MLGKKSLAVYFHLLNGLLLNHCSCTTGQGQCAFLDTDVALITGGILSIGENPKYDRVPDTSKKSGVVLQDNTTMRCNENVFNCFTLWMKNGTNKVTVLKQGCWINSGDFECSTHSCVATSKMVLKDSHFCCCKGDYCNRNLSESYIPDKSTLAPVIQTPVFVDEHYREKAIAFAISPIITVAVIIVIGFTAFRLWLRTQKESTESIHLMESSTSPSWELDSLKLNTSINGGRYGEVWKGTLNESDVAVKVFTGSGQKQYYYNEKDIYLLPHMEHDSLPCFLGAEERTTVEGINQYLLVMDYVSNGTLTNYLKHNKIDWQTMCKMCRTIASGLAHLHTDILKYDKLKPSIAHRDLNTRNILVRQDLSCVLCDFGFAMQISGSNYVKNGNQEVAEQSSLNDVGTIRYMPPEVLEGAVNLRDCEASLKQIDIYALGLVFWEIGSRCSDLYQGLPVPEYQLPFQAELGPHPSFDEMQLIVSKNKARPLFPDIWKDTNQAIRSLKETIEDCWDQDGEARLTALCVEERVLEMEALWSVRHKIGVNPTINTTNFQPTVPPLVEKKPELCNTSVVNENEIAPNQTLDMTVQEHNARNLQKLVINDVPGMPSVNIPNRSHHSVSDNSVSTATTDTLLSPMESFRPPPNVQQPPPWNTYCSRSKVLQPHQGKNPTVERNTHKRSDEDLEVQGNTLVNKNSLVTSSINTDSLPLVISDSTRTHESNRQLVRNAPRIPFMQNEVTMETQIVRPKQANIQAAGSNMREPKSFFDKLFRGHRGLGRLSLKKKGPIKMPHSKNHHMTSHVIGTQSAGASNLDKATSNLHMEHHNNILLAEDKNNVSIQQFPTEVYLQKGHPIVRTANVPLNGNQESSNFVYDCDVTEPKRYLSGNHKKVIKNDSKHNVNLLNDDQVKDNERTKQETPSSLDLSPVKTLGKVRRPNSLIINKPYVYGTGNETTANLVKNVAHHLSSPDFSDSKYMF